MKKFILISLLLSLISAVQAVEKISINWSDLQGQVEPYKDPFSALTENQLYNLSIYARITEMSKKVPKRVTDGMKEEAAAAKVELEADKIDIAYMFEQRDIIIQKRQQAAMSTNSLLADKTIEMGGFMLALEFNEGKVTEFLLVPTIGACSHKPIPSANQIVYVKTKEPVKAGSPYAAIKVTGKLLIKPQSQDLYLVDGQKEINMAYSIEDAKVEPFISTH